LLVVTPSGTYVAVDAAVCVNNQPVDEAVMLPTVIDANVEFILYVPVRPDPVPSENIPDV
jgi:hypothetical protein